MRTKNYKYWYAYCKDKLMTKNPRLKAEKVWLLKAALEQSLPVRSFSVNMIKMDQTKYAHCAKK